MKIKYFVNFHKGTTFIFVLGLMLAYHNFTLGPWIYLALHGIYGFLWLLKDQLYPDKQWEQEVSWGIGLVGFLAVSLYWIAPFILISNRVEPALPLVSAAIAWIITVNIYSGILGFVAGIFVPNMLKKDKSLSRYPEFEAYRANSGLIFPKLIKSHVQTTAQKEYSPPIENLD